VESLRSHAASAISKIGASNWPDWGRFIKDASPLTPSLTTAEQKATLLIKENRTAARQPRTCGLSWQGYAEAGSLVAPGVGMFRRPASRTVHSVRRAMWPTHPAKSSARSRWSY
jgi:hypothetical protein